MRLAILIFLVVSILSISCGSETDSTTPEIATKPEREAVPEADPEPETVPTVRSTPEVPEPVNVERFTVKEYRIYRTIIDTPTSVSESQAFANVARSERVTVVDAKAATEKVQRLLYTNNWFGSPESEIKHASDWNK